MEERREHTPLQRLPVVYWLLLALIFAGLYIFILVQFEASRSRVIHFRNITDKHTMNLASGGEQYQKPSPFGPPVRQRKVASNLKKKVFPIAQAFPAGQIRSSLKS